MLVSKGGISREIEENKLQQYKDKGYSVVTKATEEKPEKAEKPKKG